MKKLIILITLLLVTAYKITCGNINAVEERFINNNSTEILKIMQIEPDTQQVNTWVLSGVKFDKISTKLLPESYPIIDETVKNLLKDTTISIEIQCYTDNIGAQPYNQELSQKRADVVKDFLISKGISARRMKAVGYGESNPVADNKTAEGRALNNRIEIKIIPASEIVQEPAPEIKKADENPPSNNVIQEESKANPDSLKVKNNEVLPDTTNVENPDKTQNIEKQVQQQEKAKEAEPKQENKTVKQGEEKILKPYRTKDEPIKKEEQEKESNLRYFSENLAGAYWFWNSANNFYNKIGYSFVTIHGFTSDNPGDAPIIRGLNRGIGAGIFYVDNNIAASAFVHFRLKVHYVLDIGYTFGKTDLGGVYASIAYGFPIRIGKNKSIIFDLGASYIGSPAFFARLGLML